MRSRDSWRPLCGVTELGGNFVSGQLGNAAGTASLVPGGIAVETKQARENVQAILVRHGASLKRPVKVAVFLYAGERR